VQHEALVLLGLALLLLAFSTTYVNGSALSITLQPNRRQALMTASTLTQLVFSYPADSPLSPLLSGYNNTLSWAAEAPHNNEATVAFQNYLSSEYGNVTVENMSVEFRLSATANSTTLILTKHVEINAWISGVFNQTNSGLSINLAWKSFVIPGKLDVDLNNQVVDVNRVGSTLTLPFSDQSVITSAMLTMFGRQRVWEASTINFSTLSAPLSQWHRTYNANSNTTIFTRSSNALFNATASFGQANENYKLSVSYDPSSTILVPGYALANGNSVVITRSPSETFAEPEVAGGAVALVTIIAVSAVLFLRKIR
jgi:hypothetical protein